MLKQHQHHVIIVLGIISVNNWIAWGKIYDRCELYNEFVTRHGLSRLEAATWTCIAEQQSNYNTQALGAGSNGRTGYHGIFQISDLYWCSAGGACGISCERLRDDDLVDDLYCAKRIYHDHYYSFGNGYSAWPSGDYCTRHASRYTCSVAARTELIEAPPAHFTQHSDAKIYDRCELAQELHFKHHFPIDQIATWVCIAKHESHFNTSAIGAGDYGIFQISELYWCGRQWRGKACDMACSELLDADITNDVQCMKKIYGEHSRIAGNGFTAWTVYARYCNGDVSGYIEGCFEKFQKTLRGSSKVQRYAVPKKVVTHSKSNDLINFYLNFFNRSRN